MVSVVSEHACTGPGAVCACAPQGLWGGVRVCAKDTGGVRASTTSPGMCLRALGS